ncbi:hypothetical protein Tco_1365630 [Tanacetum coccineum]
MENQIVWESRQNDIRRPIPKPLVFYGPQRNPNEPPRYLYNKDLFFLKNRNTEEKKYILLLHKIHAELFPEADLEEKMNRWVYKEFKNLMKTHDCQFNIGKIHGIREYTSKIKEKSETIQKTISPITRLQKLSELPLINYMVWTSWNK